MEFENGARNVAIFRGADTRKAVGKQIISVNREKKFEVNIRSALSAGISPLCIHPMK